MKSVHFFLPGRCAGVIIRGLATPSVPSLIITPYAHAEEKGLPSALAPVLLENYITPIVNIQAEILQYY